MGQHIKTFADRSFIEYDQGKFDKWCVFYNSADGERTPPRDVDYFRELKRLAQKYGADRIYADFVEIYNMTGKELEEHKLRLITDMAFSYGRDALTVDIILSILYVAMISEEKVAYTKLGKRIKRLGVHLLLLEDKTESYAANIMRGKGWREIAADCEKRGF